MYKYPDILVDALSNEYPRKSKLHRYVIRDGQVTLRNELLSRIETLNPTTSQIFLMCNGRLSVAEILSRMLLFSGDTEKELVFSDTLKALRAMQRIGLIEKVSANL